MKNKIEKNLERFQYKYVKNDKSIIIDLGLRQEVTVTFTKDTEISITDKLKSGNILTGFLEMSLKKVIVYHSVLIAVTVLFLFYLFYYTGLNINTNLSIIIIISILGLGYLLFWYNYYHIKAESFKRTLMSWLND